MATITEKIAERFMELNQYILSSCKFGGGVKYIDIFATNDNLVYKKVSEIEKQIIEK